MSFDYREYLKTSKTIPMHDIRRTVLEMKGMPVKRVNYYTLPGDLSVAPFKYLHPNGTEYTVKVMSSDEAKIVAPKSIRPHRIMIWCEIHKRWIYAGKYIQHASMTHSKAQ